LLIPSKQLESNRQLIVSLPSFDRLYTSFKMAATTPILRPRDPNTLSNYTAWRSRHVTANLEIDFENKRLAGNVVHQLVSKTKAETKEVILDTSFLDILEIKVNGKTAPWELLPRLEPFGSALKIQLENGVDLEGAVDVDVSSHIMLGSISSADDGS
jgi:leukotriene-A4 hydrolase